MAERELLFKGKIKTIAGIPKFHFDERECNPDSELYDWFSGYDPRNKTFGGLFATAPELVEGIIKDKDDTVDVLIKIKVKRRNP